MVEQIDNASSPAYAPCRLAQCGGQLYQLHVDGEVWQFNGTNASPRWTNIGQADSVVSITASNTSLYKLRTSGELLQYSGVATYWNPVKQLSNLVSDVIASEDSFYYITRAGYTGVGRDDIANPAQTYHEIQKLYQANKDQESKLQAEITRLQGIKKGDDAIITQLQSDFTGSQGQVATLTASLQESRDTAVAKENDLQSKINQLQKDLADAEAGEKRLSDSLDAEKQKEHEEWKKAQEHDVADHKALDTAQQALLQSQGDNAALRATIDELTKDVAGKKREISKLEETVSEAQKKQELAEAELKKHVTDDVGDDTIICGLEKVIQGLKKKVEGQEILIAVLKKQLHKTSYHKGLAHEE